MMVFLAFIGVVLIWGTTPLAIQWSVTGCDILFSVMARMVLGLLICLLIHNARRRTLPVHRQALLTYLSGGLGIFTSMILTYWAARQIPSGWISVLFSLSTLLTGVMAHLFLAEPFGRERWMGVLLGTGGLSLIFLQGHATPSAHALAGIAAVLASVTIHSISSILIKRHGHTLSAFATTTGSVAVATPCFAATWLLSGGRWPDTLPPATLGSILYLGIVASVLGFTLYYFVLRKLDTSQAMLITLLAPVVALFLGTTWNGESVDANTLLGCGLILSGLAAYQWGARFLGS